MGSAPDLLGRRQQQVRAAVGEFRKRFAAGERIDPSHFIAQHPTLMPELAIELAQAGANSPFDTRTANDVALPVREAVEYRNPYQVPKGEPLALNPESSLILHHEAESTENIAPHLTITGYTLLREIHRGGQGVVFEARQKTTGQRVAIKVLRQGPLASPQELARFDREAQVLAGLRHPNIVTVLDRGRTLEGSFYLVMEFVSGHSLDEWLVAYFREHPSGPPATDPSELLRLFMRIANAVNAAHLRGVVHRDIKPSNIHIDQFGEPHILDFGLAHVFSAGDAAAAPVTITGQFLGSLPWASPEQAEGVPANIDFRTDVYSLGVILYQLLTGQFPYDVMGNMRDVLDNIMRVQPSPPSTIIAAKLARQARTRMRPKRHAAINVAIDAIVLKALAKRREDRYQTAGELARDIGNYLSGRPTMASGELPEPKTWAKTAVVWAGGMAAIALISGLAALGVDRWLRRGNVAIAESSESAPHAGETPAVKLNTAEVLAHPAPHQQPTTPHQQPTPPDPTLPSASDLAALGEKNIPAAESFAGKSAPPLPVPPHELARASNGLEELFPAVEAKPAPRESDDLAGSKPRETSQEPSLSSNQANSEKVGAAPLSPPNALVSATTSHEPRAEAMVEAIELEKGNLLRSWRIALRTTTSLAMEKPELASVAWSPDGKQLAVAGRKEGRPLIGFLDTSLNVPVKWFQQDAVMRGLRWSAPRRAVVGLSGGRDALVWSARPTSVLQLAGSYNANSLATAAAWSPDGTRIAIASSDGYVSYYDAPAGRIRNRTWLLGRAAAIVALDFSADGKFIAAAVAGEKEVALLDSNGGHLGRLPTPSGNVLSLAFAPGDTHLAIASGPEKPGGTGMVEVWDSPTLKSLSRFPVPGTAYAVAWSPRGGQLAVAYGEDDFMPGALGLFRTGASAAAWRVEQAVAPRLLAGHPITWSPNGELVASVSGDQKITAYDAQSGKSRMVLVSYDRSPPLAVSPNGHFRGPKSAENEIVYIATTSDGKEKSLEPTEFFARFGVSNNPDSVTLLPER